MANCTQCGSTIPEGNSFCTKCGTPVANQSTPVSEQATTVSPKVDSAQTTVMPAASAAQQPTTVQQPVTQTAGPGATRQMPVQPAQQMQPAQQQFIAEQPAQGEQPKKKGSKKTVIIVAIIAVIVIAVAAVVAFNVINGGKKSSPSVTPTQTTQASNAPAKAESVDEQEPPSNANAEVSVTNTDGYILPDSNSRYLTDSDLSTLTDYELYLARNEIFARHGRGFNNEDLKSYFNSQPWYTQLYTPEEFDALENILNDYEIQNAQLIQSTEESRKSN